MIRQLVCFFLLMSTLLGKQVFADLPLFWKEISLPTAEATAVGLETLLVWTEDKPKHPLVILTNGAPRDLAARREMTAISYLPIAKAFVQRGFSVAVVLRRGYGGSGGEHAEDSPHCSTVDYQKIAQAGAIDLRAAIKYLSTLPQIDNKAVILIGHSAGGYAALALAADNPPENLQAIISVAGGRGSQSDNKICKKDQLIENFARFGKTSRLPTLWIYSENDKFFNPILAKEFYTEFTTNGGKAQLEIIPAFEQEGHFIFSSKGLPLWIPLADNFLKKHSLMSDMPLLTLVNTSHLKTPKNMTAQELKAFQEYENAAPHKAFAENGKGRFGWRTGRHTIAEAQKSALQYCKNDRYTDCKIIAVDDNMVPVIPSDK